MHVGRHSLYSLKVLTCEGWVGGEMERHAPQVKIRGRVTE